MHQYVFVMAIVRAHVCIIFIFLCLLNSVRSQLDLTLEATMARDSCVFQAIKKYGVAGYPLAANEDRDVGRLCEVGKVALMESAHDFVRSSNGRPLLYEYVGDGTPLKLKHAFKVAFAEHHRSHRSGYTGVELYCQGAFLRSFDSCGSPQVRCLLRDPRPMGGKSGLHAFNALLEFFPALDELPHVGINLHHYSWDRALFSACKGYARQHHTVILRNIADSSLPHVGIQKVLKSWLVFTGCGLHDVHNGFAWGTSRYLFEGKEMLDELFIVIESLRNGYKHLQSHLSSFLLEHVLFQDGQVSRDSLLEFWTALDVPAELCHMLADRGVLWIGDRLQINASYRHDPELLPWLYNACMTVFRFKKFSCSRWLTIGCSLRTLIAACALGIRRLHAFTMADSSVGQHYIKGFGRLNEAMLHYSLIAAISARPSEALSLALLEDDRAVMHIDAYEAHLRDEVTWIEDISEPVWEMLASVVKPGSFCRAVRSECLDAAHASCAYIYMHFLKEVRSMPWSLAVGDVSANLDVLEASDQTLRDPVAKKIKQLLQMKSNRVELVEGVGMLRECRWSTVLAEQLHAHGAVLHKLHREYGEETLCARTGCSYLRHLTAQEPLQKEEQKAKKKLTLLSRKNPDKATGRHNFLGAFAHTAKEIKAPTRKLTLEETRANWAQGSKQWDAMPASVKRVYASSASEASSAKRKCLEEDKAHVLCNIAQTRRRLTEEAEQEGLMSRLSSCKMSDAQRQRLQHLWETLEDVPRLRKSAMAPVDVPPPRVVAALKTVEIPPSVSQDVRPQEWCKRICKHRDLFVSTALAVVSGHEKRWYAFMYACQSPQDVILMPMQVIDEVSKPVHVHTFDKYSIGVAFRFNLCLGSYISGRALALTVDEYMFVLPGLCHSIGAGQVESHHPELIWYQDFLRGQPEASAEGRAAQKNGRSSGQEQLAKQHPWMMKAMERRNQADVEEKKQTEDEEKAKDEMPEMAVDDVAAVMAKLEEHRADMQAVYEDHCVIDFEVVVLGGRWTMQHVGVACDASKGQAKGQRAKDWCRIHGLSMSFSCSFKQCGETMAHDLCHEWCRRMQFFFSWHEAHPGSDVDWHDIANQYEEGEDFVQLMRSARSQEIHKRGAVLRAIVPS